MEIDLSQFYGFGLAPVVIALVAIAKRWITDERWWPILALALGVALNVGLATILKVDLATAAAVGLLVGLAASGLYSNAKAPTKAAPN